MPCGFKLTGVAALRDVGAGHANDIELAVLVDTFMRFASELDFVASSITPDCAGAAHRRRVGGQDAAALKGATGSCSAIVVDGFNIAVQIAVSGAQVVCVCFSVVAAKFTAIRLSAQLCAMCFEFEECPESVRVSGSLTMREIGRASCRERVCMSVV